MAILLLFKTIFHILALIYRLLSNISVKTNTPSSCVFIVISHQIADITIASQQHLLSSPKVFRQRSSIVLNESIAFTILT